MTLSPRSLSGEGEKVLRSGLIDMEFISTQACVCSRMKELSGCRERKADHYSEYMETSREWREMGKQIQIGLNVPIESGPLVPLTSKTVDSYHSSHCFRSFMHLA